MEPTPFHTWGPHLNLGHKVNFRSFDRVSRDAELITSEGWERDSCTTEDGCCSRDDLIFWKNPGTNAGDPTTPSLVFPVEHLTCG